jgi:predicted MFS family arabinose efflux permease
VRSRLIVLICLTVGSSTFPIGAFPALLPDLDRVVGLSDVELGALAAAFGFARMIVDIPVGLFVMRHLRLALRVAPVAVTIGMLLIGTGGPFAVLLGGRLLMGVAHAIGMVSWLTTVLRYQTGPSLGIALNAIEFTAMLGMLTGVGLVGVLPKTWSWNHVLLVACAPQLAGIVLGQLLARALPRTEPPAAMPAPQAAATPAATSRYTPAITLAFVTGAVVAITYATLELYVIPLRGSREFGLDRSGVARLLMLAQLADILALLPAGMLADRLGAGRLLSAVTVLMASALVLTGFGGVGALTAGAAFFGLGMAGWMLPLAILRRDTPPELIAWRTALYRVGVDGGLFLGPFLSGVLGPHAWMLAAGLAAVLVSLAVSIAVVERSAAGPR